MASNRYTKAELKIINSDLPDEVVASQTGRTIMAIYCKRWSIRNRKHVNPATRVYRYTPTVASEVIAKTTEKQINQIVFGNVTITIKDKSLIINM